MKYALAAALMLVPSVMLVSTPAAAQSKELENACVNVAKNFLMTPVLATGTVQSFPELDPPGARLTYSTRDNPKPNDFTNTIDCQFDKATAPIGLTKFCISTTCYSADEQDPDNRRRYLEIKALMDRKK
ncbi:hypothetical protein J2T09_003951 [Neorhizobium huautlense]|uniref:Uncharacterized protein n=1 Tax=Neorhizobium huautlense TaxID=67774 RepID=A0ABT9PXH2_9HYPH|nr:hypothetical protein [Neorhizobium huautlense]MDP9839176.1 hypothetical protein [Neorhizobium huautlense]